MALARAYLSGTPDAGDAQFWEALGIPPEMRDGIVASTTITPVWPENQVPFEVFMALMTQWRVGMSGPTGLDYAAVPVVMKFYQVAPADRRRVFDDLRVMESEALKVFADGRQQNQHHTNR
jgi:hypothetical protein